jgi:ABC-type lipoprotein export system ATPase subunit
MTDANGSVLEIRRLSFAYPGRKPLCFPDASLAPGEAVSLIGPSGSGKSTLVMLVAGLLEPRGGEILVDGNRLASQRGAARDRLRGRLIGAVLQSFRLLPRLSVLENLTLAQYLSGRRVDSKAALLTLEALDIGPFAQERPANLSRGQLQRAAIARAVVNRPALVLADEPTSSLDDESANAVLDLLLHHTQRLGAALLIATHDRRVTNLVPQAIALRRRETA